MQVECGIFVDVGVAFGAIQIKGHKIVKVSKILAICAIVLCCCIWISSLVRMEFLNHFGILVGAMVFCGEVGRVGVEDACLWSMSIRLD